jgi:hypothetical protein
MEEDKFYVCDVRTGAKRGECTNCYYGKLEEARRRAGVERTKVKVTDWGGESVPMKHKPANRVTEDDLDEIYSEFCDVNGLPNEWGCEVRLNSNRNAVYVRGEVAAKKVGGEWFVMRFCGHGIMQLHPEKREPEEKGPRTGQKQNKKSGLHREIDRAYARFCSKRGLDHGAGSGERQIRRLGEESYQRYLYEKANQKTINDIQ